jgi:hypothetical protein
MLQQEIKQSQNSKLVSEAKKLISEDFFGADANKGGNTEKISQSHNQHETQPANPSN